MRRAMRIYKAVGCKTPATLFSEVLHDGRFVDELIKIVYDTPCVMRYFGRSWYEFIYSVYMSAQAFDAVMDRVAATLNETTKVHVIPGSVTDDRVARMLVHVLDRYPGKFVFMVGGTTCLEDVDVLDVVLQNRIKF